MICVISYTKRVAETDRAALLSFSGIEKWIPKQYIAKTGKKVIAPDWFFAKIGFDPVKFARYEIVHHKPYQIKENPNYDQSLFRSKESD